LGSWLAALVEMHPETDDFTKDVLFDLMGGDDEAPDEETRMMTTQKTHSRDA
jgi:hypothetical protein